MPSASVPQSARDCQKEADMGKKQLNILYERLSRDDERAGESASIENQKAILEDYAVRSGLTPFLHLSDDGYSGTSWDRPGWQELVSRVESGEVAAIIVKDSSRMGRDYLRVGLYREMFRERGVRLICVSEGLDSARGDDDFTPFREIIAEWYARDTSRKIKAVIHAKGNSGKPLTSSAIYGYRKAEDDHNVWVTDAPAAAVVRRIFDMALDGLGPYQIARRLSEARIERPTAHFARTLGRLDPKPEMPFAWSGPTVVKILASPEYCGHTVNFRTRRESFKSKKAKRNPKSEWQVFENTHPAIIDSEDFETVQRLRSTPRRIDTLGAPNPLTGLLFCADCGAKMYNSRSVNPKIADHYKCSTHSLARSTFGEKCSQHYIRTAVVNALVLDAIRSVCGYVRGHEAEFAQRVREMSAVQAKESAKAGRRKLSENDRRTAELDRLFKRIYEDFAAEKLSEKRFEQLSVEYEREQLELEAASTTIRADLEAIEADSFRVDRFLDLARKYTHFEELTPALLNAFVEKILVHEADKSSGERVQEVEIVFNFIGRFDVPLGEGSPPDEPSADEESRRHKRARQREYNRKWYAKHRAAKAAPGVG